MSRQIISLKKERGGWLTIYINKKPSPKIYIKELTETTRNKAIEKLKEIGIMHPDDIAYVFDQVEEKKPSLGIYESITQQVNWLKFAESFVDTRGVFYDKSKNWWVWNITDYCWELIDETDIMNEIDVALQNLLFPFEPAPIKQKMSWIK